MWRVVTAIVVGLALLPVVSSAITIEELTDQIAVLLAQVAELQQKVVEASANEQAQTTTSSTATPTASVASSCPAIVRTLSRGKRGDDVLQLQNFLIAQKFLASDSATGFYGPVTESAVKQWQSGHSVVSSGSPDTTGWGTVGTRTRAAIRSACGDTSAAPTNDYLSVSSLGLSANMKLIVNVHGSCAAYEYTLNFGDGTDTEPVLVPAGSCHPIELSVVHTYASGGNYTVTLSSGRGTVTVPITLRSVAATGNECRAPQFATDTIPVAVINATWTLPLVTETLSGLPAVRVDGLPVGISLQKQIQVSAQAATSSNAWILSGVPVQAGTYAFSIHMENACGKADRTITLPVNSL
jgi:hypothetical protein